MSGISTVVSVPYRSFVTEGKAGVRSGNSASGNRGCQNNAKLNGITNAQFFVGKAEEVLPQFYENAKKKRISLMIQHPPDIQICFARM